MLIYLFLLSKKEKSLMMFVSMNWLVRKIKREKERIEKESNNFSPVIPEKLKKF